MIKVYIEHSLSYLEIYNDSIFDLLATLPDNNIGDSVTSEQPKPLNIAEVIPCTNSVKSVHRFSCCPIVSCLTFNPSLLLLERENPPISMNGKE